MYIKLNNGNIEQYPYSKKRLLSDNPNVSFPEAIPDSLLAEYGVFKIKEVASPVVDHTKNIVELEPQLVNGEWTQVWGVLDASYDDILQRVLQLRASEYPPMADYLDGVVKGDQAQVDKYIADCLAVKAKYPKPLPPV